MDGNSHQETRCRKSTNQEICLWKSQGLGKDTKLTSMRLKLQQSTVVAQENQDGLLPHTATFSVSVE